MRGTLHKATGKTLPSSEYPDTGEHFHQVHVLSSTALKKVKSTVEFDCVHYFFLVPKILCAHNFREGQSKSRVRFCSILL